ncbi:MAG TPA: hypothetical protein VE642_00830, partial [Pyrinomonadaceae bacterium]|nr:hypothetical protein [Pyrinomonadaceae bacterium]
MKLKKSFALVLLLACVLNTQAQVPPGQVVPPPFPARRNLMPVPASMQWGAGRLAVTKSFTVAATGHVDERLRAGVERAMRRLEGRTVTEFARGLAAEAGAATLVVDCKGPGQAVPSVEENESYTLDVNDRQATLRAPT